jgi:hypothetical protein
MHFFQGHTMNFKLKKTIAISLAFALGVQLSGCGTILQPERKGQRAGQLDPSIVVLDAIGLLFFIVPGVIAFAVDFNNGTIYLPGGRAEIDNEGINKLQIEGEITNEKIQRVILAQTGRAVVLDSNSAQTIENSDETLKDTIKFL